jgi:hypothetical protein
MIRRYDNALRALGRDAPPEVAALLRQHQAENRQHLEILTKVAADVIKASR